MARGAKVSCRCDSGRVVGRGRRRSQQELAGQSLCDMKWYGAARFNTANQFLIPFPLLMSNSESHSLQKTFH